MDGEIKTVVGDARLTSEQRNTLTRFEEQMRLEGRTYLTRVSYLRGMLRFSEYMKGRPFEEATGETFKRFMLDMQAKKMSANTIRHEYGMVHRFYGWLADELGAEERYEKLMKKCRYKAPAGERHVIKAEDLPTTEEIKQIIKFAEGTRDKAIVAMMYDLGTRPHELMNLKVRDVHFDEMGILLTVGEHGKTGARTVRPIFSLPYIREWLESHPLRENGDAPLFPQMGHPHYGGQLTVHTLRHIIVTAVKRAGIEKRVYSYLFRHTAITREACNGLSDQLLKNFFGWTPDSQMLRVYSHLKNEDANRARLIHAGLMKSEEQKQHDVESPKCLRCGLENTATAEYCSRCASPLDEKRYRELMSREQEITALKQEMEKLRTAQGVSTEQLKDLLAGSMPEIVELLAKKAMTK